ncbi:DUF3987 domain-containing protein [Jiulongibacter sediminis]|uniref:DUF3987 domain-containing protein n=1 Tax=Jiulongibacter sediminis TaxID=1605367 RepID=UPI0026EE3A40|nr:DUF3987 domain-containing protein [Jiulongibacter sediminis]
MNTDSFNVADWLNPQSDKKTVESETPTAVLDKYQEVEQLIAELVSKGIDLTSSYEDWRNIGFALSEAFGENGRELYQQVSSLYPDYNSTECNKQFNNCLKAKGSGINLSTLFYLASIAGVTVKTPGLRSPFSKQTSSKPKPVKIEQENISLPTLPDELFLKLPEFLKKATEVAESNEERDLLLLGSLVTLSSVMPSVFGYYHKQKCFANLFLFISAQASAGKGRLNHCRKLVKPIHDQIREDGKKLKNAYELELSNYNANKKTQPDLEKPSQPPMKLLFIPANSSSAGFFQLLSDNEGRGLLFETEGDTLANTLKSDYGNYSDGFRKAFHHESISYYRKTDREHVELEKPCITAVLCGTPMQILNLVDGTENGLFSRIIFYHMTLQPDWADVFNFENAVDLDDYFYDLGKEFQVLYNELLAMPPIQFSLSRDQQIAFNQFFSQSFQQYYNLKGEEYASVIRRMGLIAFRFAMILSVTRLMDSGEIPATLTCEQADFETALSFADTLMVHSSYVLNQLPETNKPQKRQNKREQFYESLPEKFNRQKYLEVASKLDIKEKTAESYITRFVDVGLIHREMKDSYIKK